MKMKIMGMAMPTVRRAASSSLGISDMEQWRYRALAQMRTRFVEERVPFFATNDGAAKAVRELINYYRRRGEVAA
ncbi:hypothetical protein ACFLV0_07585 [Chloroflexota bacterium]